MRKIRWVAACAVLAVAAAAGWTAPAARKARASAEPPVSAAAMYYVGAAEGYVAVYDGQHRAVVSLLDTPLRSLPEEERSRLLQGIPVYSENELQQLLEDFA